jgi:Domain of unknown function (DUF2760)
VASVPRESCIKPNVTAQSLPWWRRVGLAFGVFFKILFDARFAAALPGGGAEGTSSPAPPVAAPATGVAAPGLAFSHESSQEGALLLLSLLQTEGRFVDFVQQDVMPFPDADVGAVARVVHAGCRKVLGAHLRIEAIRSESEGQSVALEPGFDPSRIKLTGKVSGVGRLVGVLRHRGWQATDVRLPSVVDRAGSRILCPAEVEL